MQQQSTDTILMVRPAAFGFNPETAENNAFQSNETDLSLTEISAAALKEFDDMVAGLRDHGVNVIVVEDSADPIKTDAVYPNNWFSTHVDGALYVYPMFSPNRRLERRSEIIEMLCKDYSLSLKENFLAGESDARFLEGTGSMILDRPNKIIYACYSIRTDKDLLNRFGREIGYEVVGFEALDEAGIPYYHTNVIMALGSNIAVICTESIPEDKMRKFLVDKLLSTDKQIVEITRDQVLAFAGNMLEVQSSRHLPLLVMSTAAYKSLTKSQLDIIEEHNVIFHSSLTTIEKFGGGSARCMIAEIFSSI